MTHPLKNGTAPSTPFGARGYSWSCNKDSSGRGQHTGADWKGAIGTPVYAVVDGHLRGRNYGSAFGTKQVAVSPDDPGEWFYAHLSWIDRNLLNKWVKAGTLIGRIGAEGNVTGPHLHLERKRTKGSWFCGDQMDPWAEIQRLDGSGPPEWEYPGGTKIHLKYLKWKGHELNDDKKSTSIGAWQDMLNRHSMPGGTNLPITEEWHEMTATETQLCQRLHIPPEDSPLTAVFAGPKQAAHLLEATGAPYEIVPEAEPEPPKVSPWLSEAAKRMRDEIDAIFPGRDKRTDGWIGDANHTTGEHVPDKDTGVVRAIDVDADLDQRNNGASQQLADLLLRYGRDGLDRGRLYYVIHNGRIASGTYKETFWTWRPYDGANPHTSHIHISFKPAGDRDATEWDLLGGLEPEPPVIEPPVIEPPVIEPEPVPDCSAEIEAAVAAAVAEFKDRVLKCLDAPS